MMSTLTVYNKSERLQNRKSKYTFRADKAAIFFFLVCNENDCVVSKTLLVNRIDSVC